MALRGDGDGEGIVAMYEYVAMNKITAAVLASY